MKPFVGALMLGLILLVTVSTQAAEPAAADLSANDLSALGLGGLTVVSDDAGSQVRGMGNFVQGGSFAWGFTPLSLSFSQNTYTAQGTTYSQGGNASYAGLGIPVVGGIALPFPFLGGLLTGRGALAGGGSFAQHN